MTTATTAPPFSFFRNTINAGTHSLVLLRSWNLAIVTSPNSFLIRSNKLRLLRLSSSLADRQLDISWLPLGQTTADSDDYNGWAVVEAPPPSKKKKSFSTIIIAGIGTCVATFLAAVAYFTLYRKGYKLEFSGPLRALHGMISPTETEADKIERRDMSIPKLDGNVKAASPENVLDVTVETLTSASSEKLEHVRASIPLDSTQLEALSVLKKLKIIDDDIRGDEFCTRKEYARWLVHLNSLLERNPRQRIVPSVSLSGSVIVAFDDIGVEDPDFEAIQALAEAGIIPSKLSGASCCPNGLVGYESFCFYPERLVSRQDLINWKAQLEYGFLPALTEQISRTQVDYMDVKHISSDASPELFIDMLAGDNSLIRKVFGQTRRFQPNKPSTKAQAAVALTSGMMTEAVNNELLRLEAEYSSREATMQEIRSELLERGDMERFWVEKIKEERTHRFEVKKIYNAILHDLEREKIVQVKTSADHLKEKAVMDCQRQLLLNMKKEVGEMSERLASERVIYVSEQCNQQGLLGELQTKQEGMLDAKAVLEAEIEALRILRSWVEDEARKSQARAKDLEEARRRWQWDNKA